jgi:hypothetical protein
MLDYLLNLFTGDDDLRPQFQTPFRIGEYVYATDAHTLIKIPAHLLKREYPINDKAPKNLDNMFIGYTEIKTFQFDVRIDHLAALLAEIKYVYKRNACPKCNGTSEITCEHCGHASPCKECNGTGHSNDINFLVRKEKEYAALRYNGNLYRPFVLERLLISLMALQARKNEIVQYHKNNYSLFVIGDVEIVLVQQVEM